ncbi:MAG TPA: hypothetical protein VGK63_05165 [Candidatus Limnocylindrales bacterium]
MNRRRTAANVVLGALAGVGATGVVAGLTVIGRQLDIGQPIIDTSGPILIAPVIAVPFVAGGLLIGSAGIAAVVGGAVAAPLVAALAIHGDCEATSWTVLGLMLGALAVLPIAGVAGVAGDRLAQARAFRTSTFRAAVVLVPIGALGIAGWLAALSSVGGCGPA